MWTELSDPAILKKLGIQIREYLMKMEMIQNELAEKSKVSMGSVVRLEKCNPVSILLFISVLRMLGILENLKGFVARIRYKSYTDETDARKKRK